MFESCQRLWLSTSPDSPFCLSQKTTVCFPQKSLKWPKSDIKISILKFLFFHRFKIVFFSSDLLSLLQAHLIAMPDQQSKNRDQQNQEVSVFITNVEINLSHEFVEKHRLFDFAIFMHFFILPQKSTTTVLVDSVVTRKWYGRRLWNYNMDFSPRHLGYNSWLFDIKCDILMISAFYNTRIVRFLWFNMVMTGLFLNAKPCLYKLLLESLLR